MPNTKLVERFRIRISDIVISVVSDGSTPRLRVKSGYRRFMTDTEPQVVFRVHYGEIPQYSWEEKIFDSGGSWSLYRSNGKRILSLCAPPMRLPPDKLAMLSPDFKSGDIYIRRFGKSHRSFLPNPLEYPLDRILMVNLLSKGLGVMIHACAINDNGRGILFVGSSGVGKSTLANLWKRKTRQETTSSASATKQVSILSDDRIIIRQIDGLFWIYGTPWSGSAGVSSPERALLDKIFFIRHAKKNTITNMENLEAASRLIACSFPTFWDESGMEFTLGFCAELSREIPCYELGFVPGESVLDLVEDYE